MDERFIDTTRSSRSNNISSFFFLSLSLLFGENSTKVLFNAIFFTRNASDVCEEKEILQKLFFFCSFGIEMNNNKKAVEEEEGFRGRMLLSKGSKRRKEQQDTEKMWSIPLVFGRVWLIDGN